MNIFVLDRNPVEAAKYHCNKHVNKMLVESVQMLCTVYRSIRPMEITSDLDEVLYKPTHENHPCMKWLYESFKNWCWLYVLAWSLYAEFNHRKGLYEDMSTRWTHKSGEVLRVIHGRLLTDQHLYGSYNMHSEEDRQRFRQVRILYTKDGEIERWCFCMPDEFKKTNDIVESYRNYYKHKMQTMKSPDWGIRGEPQWLMDGMANVR